jgi:hypothetical protein
MTLDKEDLAAIDEIITRKLAGSLLIPTQDEDRNQREYDKAINAVLDGDKVALNRFKDRGGWIPVKK